MKRLIVIIVTTVVLSAIAVMTVLAANKQQKPLTELPNGVHLPGDMPLITNPEPLYKANLALDTGEFKVQPNNSVRNKQIVDLDGEIRYEAIMSYGEYAESFNDGNRNTAVDDERLVYVLQAFYPEFEHVKVGLINDCLATGVYDAETGDYLGGKFESVQN
jgi:hypothetical protein